MKWQINKRYFRIGLMAFAVIAASICFYYLIFHGDRFSAQINSLIRVVNPVLYGIVFAYLMTPMVNGIERQLLIPLFFKNKTLISSKQKKYMRFFSIILTMIVVILMIYGFFFYTDC